MNTTLMLAQELLNGVVVVILQMKWKFWMWRHVNKGSHTIQNAWRCFEFHNQDMNAKDIDWWLDVQCRHSRL